MPNISLVSAQFNAPGVYLSQNTNGNISSTINSFTAAYMYGEVYGSVSTSLTTGLPYNVPLLITSLEDFEIRLGNGNVSNFITPTSGPELTTYNSIKQFFRNAVTEVGASLYFIRVKPVDSFILTVTNSPDVFTITDDAGLAQTVYGYPLEINNVQLGRVEYDITGAATHIGVQVSATTTAAEATLKIIDVIKKSPLSSSIVIQDLDGADNILRLYPRNNNGVIYINDINTSTFVPGSDNRYDFDSFNVYKYDPLVDSPDVSAVNASDYIYSIETALDPSVFPPGFLMAPAAFAKYNPKDRLAVGTALEQKASEIDYSWMAIVDCGPQDGSDIVNHYKYETLDLSTYSSLPTNGDPFYVAETQEFYTYNPDPLFTHAPNDFVQTNEIFLDSNYLTILTNTPQDVLIKAGSVINVYNDDAYYVVNEDFTPTDVIILLNDPVGDGSTRSGLLTEVKAMRNVVQLSDVTVAVANIQLTSGQYIRGSQLVGGIPATNTYYRVQANFTPTVLPIDPANPRGTGTPEPSLLSGSNHWVAKGQILNNNGTLYYVRKSFALTTLGEIPNSNSGILDRDIPLAFYKLWIQENLNASTIKLATFSPSNLESIRLGARNVLFNNASHEALQREHLMYTSPLGHLAYYAPYLVDLEGFNVPPSSAVIGIALRVYRERGFFEPVGGVSYPLSGVLRPQFNITRAHQQQSNPTGLNAIRLLPNQGTVIWGARTRSSNKLFKWINTRIIMNVVINSLRNSFDDKLFRAIDGTQTMFREIRGTAENILYRLWSGGALFGANPNDAYRVICNDSINSNFSIEDGVVNVQIFVVPVSTLEVITISITRSAIGNLTTVISGVGTNTASVSQEQLLV